MWEIIDILKISKSSAENHLHQLGYVNCFDVPWKLNRKKKKTETFLTVFPHTILYLGVTKPFHFKNKLLWEMKSGYCTIMQNRRDNEHLK